MIRPAHARGGWLMSHSARRLLAPFEYILSVRLPGRLLSQHSPDEVGKSIPGEQESDPSRRGGPAPRQGLGHTPQGTGKKCLCVLDDCMIIGVRCTLAPGGEPVACSGQQTASHRASNPTFIWGDHT
jgi:hypothetical protein